MPFLAGASRLPYLRFLTYNAIGCILWAVIFSLLGYLFGQSWHLIERWVGRAGVVAAILIAMVVVTFWLWRGIASRELEIREWWRQFCERPAVKKLRTRFARQIDWLEQRLSPDGYLGIHLTVGIFLLLAATAIFSGLLQQIGTRDWFIMADLRVAEWFANRAGGPVSAAMNYIAHLGSAFWLAVLVLVAVLICRRDHHRLRLLVVAAPGGLLLDFLLKQFFARERPHFGHALGRGMSVGPLDGDLMIATVVYGVLAYVLVRSLGHWHWRALVIFATILLIFFVALSSLYFGASQLSDAVAAMIEGTAWLLFCISGVEIVRWRENARDSTACI